MEPICRASLNPYKQALGLDTRGGASRRPEDTVTAYTRTHHPFVKAEGGDAGLMLKSSLGLQRVKQQDCHHHHTSASYKPSSWLIKQIFP